MARSFFIHIFLAFFLLFSSAEAAENIVPIKEKLYYEAYWSGVSFGKIGIHIEQEATKANVTCDLTSTGILSWFVKHSSHSTLTASGADFIYPNRVYETNYQTRKKARYIKLTYQNGKVIDEIIEPPDSHDKRPPVPGEDKHTAYDLMSFLLRLRSEITDARKNNNPAITLNTFDGRRLSQIDMNIIGEKNIKIGNENQSTIVVSARRKLLAGYTDKELQRYKPDEPSLTIYFSNDEKLIPLRMEVPFLGQNITATLVKKCGPDESCLLGNKN